MFEAFLLSERPGSNRRHSAWKADALPTELLSRYRGQIYNGFIVIQVVLGSNFDIFYKWLLEKRIGGGYF